MANGVNSRVNITWDDFKTYLPNYKFDEKQMEFFKNTLESILHNRNTNKVTCFGARCGIGKSTMIHTLMHSCIANFRYEGRDVPQGLIVITDSIKRLEELSSSNKDLAKKYWGEYFRDLGIEYHYEDFERNTIVLKSDEPFKKQMISQRYKPIVLLSTQRYFMLSKNTREEMDSHS